jgi:hypothetical protein
MGSSTLAASPKKFSGIMGVTARITDETKRVRSRVYAKEKKAVFSAAKYGRTTMQRGMRKRKGASLPGAYPHTHHGALRDLIVFDVDPSLSAVIGPVLFPPKYNDDTGTARSIPQLINEGGVATRSILISSRDEHGFARHHRKKVRAHYQPRPFVALVTGPTVAMLLKNLETIPL